MLLPPVGFLSYARQDDQLSGQKLSKLRELIKAELQLQYGREPVKLFQDVSAIPHGAAWEAETLNALGESTFFLPIITPNFIQSEWCCREVMLFLEREQRLFALYPDLPPVSRIFPIFYRNIREGNAHDVEALAALKKRQWWDFRELRDKDYQAEQVSRAVSDFAESICDLLHIQVQRPPTAEELARQQAEAEAARKQAEESAQRKAEEALVAAREAEARRAAAEAEAEAERLRAAQAAEARERAEAEEWERRQRERERAAAKQAEIRAAGKVALAAHRRKMFAALKGSFRQLRFVVLPGALALILAVAVYALVFTNSAPAPADPPSNAAAGGSVRPSPAPTSAAAADEAAPGAAWLEGRWSMDTCSTFIDIEAEEETLRITAGSETYRRRITGYPDAMSVATPEGVYRLGRDGVMRSSEPDMKGLEWGRCGG